MKRVVDTSAFIERFAATPLREEVNRHLPAFPDWIVPTIVQFELAKWLLRAPYPEPMRIAEAMTDDCTVVDLTPRIAAEAARMWDEYKLATADAIIYATARVHQADLLTCDRHFAGLPGVVYLAKPSA